MLDVLKHILHAGAPADARWVALRRRERATDFALTGTARRWLRQLPPRRRPLLLCMSHPRVANRIAWCWSDSALATQVLEDLLVDHRGGRRGFAPQVVRELRRLREFNEQHRIEPRPQGLWQVLGRVVGVD
jgi:hypothetical protein